MFRRNKKGDLVEVFNIEIIYLILGIIIIVALVAGIDKLFDRRNQVNFAENYDSVLNFDRLASTIAKLSDSPHTYDSETLRYSLTDKFIVVGFDKQSSPKTKTNCYSWTTGDFTAETITRPAKCGPHACLCLWPDSAGDDFDDDLDNLEHKCQPIVKADYILTHFCGEDDLDINCAVTQVPEGVWKNTQALARDYGSLTSYDTTWKGTYSPFLLYGECQAWTSDETFRNTLLHIDKFTNSDGKNILFLATKTEATEKRKDFLDQKYPKITLAQALADKSSHPEDVLRLMAHTYATNETYFKTQAKEMAIFIKRNEQFTRQWLSDGLRYEYVKTGGIVKSINKELIITEILIALPEGEEKKFLQNFR